MTYLAVVSLLLLAAAVLFLVCCWLGREPRDFWSISIFTGPDPLSLMPHPEAGDRAVLTAAHVTDTRARFVADPFLLRSSTGWHMFFEVYDEPLKRGVISHATSADGVTWQYDCVVLEEPFHLSYPHVFEHDGEFFMTPESGDFGEVRLYRAGRFPTEWQLDTVLLKGRYYDPTLLLQAGRWWMWVCDERSTPLLFSAEQLRGPWQPHACNARSRPDPHFGRPGGRVLRTETRLLRFVQDGVPTYGSRLHARAVDQLAPGEYAESPASDSPVLAGAGSQWRATGMHHLDAWPTPSGWIAAVDGNQQRVVYNWRAGARMMQRWLLGRSRQ